MNRSGTVGDVIKLNLRLPSGLQIDFEGELAELAEVIDVVASLPESSGSTSGLEGENGDDEELDPSLAEQSGHPLEPQVLQARLQRVGATTDIERVTVMAQAAVEGKEEGLDFDTAARIFDALAIRKPARWKATFSNARTKGYLQNVGRGLWRPTVHGENFAKYGPKNGPAKRRAASKRKPPVDQPSLQEGGDDDG